MSEREHERFVNAVRQHLDAQADGLDARTVARLQAARRHALDAHRAGVQRWWPAFGVASAAAVLLALLLWQSTPAPPLSLEDWEIVVSGDDLDLIEEYEFYEWLDTTQAAG